MQSFVKSAFQSKVRAKEVQTDPMLMPELLKVWRCNHSHLYQFAIVPSVPRMMSSSRFASIRSLDAVVFLMGWGEMSKLRRAGVLWVAGARHVDVTFQAAGVPQRQEPRGVHEGREQQRAEGRGAPRRAEARGRWQPRGQARGGLRGGAARRASAQAKVGEEDARGASPCQTVNPAISPVLAHNPTG